MNEHYIGEQGIKTTLKEFVEKAIETLRDKPIIDRAVKFADDITDIRELGHSAPLESIYPLPADYRYGYSGFAGCILYVEKSQKSKGREKMKPIRIVRPGEIFMKEDEEGIEFYFYKHRNGERKNYTYKVTYSYEIWKDALSEAGITIEDIKNHRVSIKLYPHGGIRFTKD